MGLGLISWKGEFVGVSHLYGGLLGPIDDDWKASQKFIALVALKLPLAFWTLDELP